MVNVIGEGGGFERVSCAHNVRDDKPFDYITSEPRTWAGLSRDGGGGGGGGFSAIKYSTLNCGTDLNER